MGGSEFLCRVIYTHYRAGYPSQPGRKEGISGLIFSTEAWEVLPQGRCPSQVCGLQREAHTLGNPQCGHTPSSRWLLSSCSFVGRAQEQWVSSFLTMLGDR